jgi:hypothetical protein
MNPMISVANEVVGRVAHQGAHQFGTAAGIGAIFCGAVALLLLVVVAGRLWRYRRTPDNADCLNGFSLARYEPMTRLLSREDLEFLAALPGYRPAIGSKLERDRRRIFRMYLRELAADFQALHASARKMASISPEQHSDVVGSLVRQQVTFWFALTAIEVRLMLPRAAGVDVRGLVEGLISSAEALRMDLERLAAPAVSAV